MRKTNYEIWNSIDVAKWQHKKRQQTFPTKKKTKHLFLRARCVSNLSHKIPPQLINRLRKLNNITLNAQLLLLICVKSSTLWKALFICRKERKRHLSYFEYRLPLLCHIFVCRCQWFMCAYFLFLSFLAFFYSGTICYTYRELCNHKNIFFFGKKLNVSLACDAICLWGGLNWSETGFWD